jgi:thioredoxin reductase (NADPH)
VPGEATRLEQRDGQHVVGLGDGRAVAARVVVIATGARYRRLAVPNLERFEGTSVHYAATQVEALLCRGDPVAVVGGGNSAGQATLFLIEHAARVRLLIRDRDLGASMSRYLADRIRHSAGVDTLPHTEVRELLGETVLEGLIAEDNRTGERRRLEASALFVFIGAEPYTQWLRDELALDDRGFVLTGADAANDAGRTPLPLESSRPGCSPPATCAADRSSGWPQPSARGPWSSAWCSNTSRSGRDARNRLERRALRPTDGSASRPGRWRRTRRTRAGPARSG